ncbi:arginine N-methyltransferase [Brachionus plicatilis]|uniref:type I protein arginine methyltransferase n=1 Tax=Brachionus plicatilis TaxID=10195 RepID=A0A3M7S7S1_BRAPC|nr:arginine N-methyltransferase [Brachionus plicatilis]
MTTLDEKPGSYFDSYDNVTVHNLMLRDKPRVTKYRDAIMKSKNLFKDKVVLDVGSGTGILSIFSAQAGAKHVYAIEACRGIAELSKSIIKDNGMDDKITVLNEEVEKLDLPVKEVDIIVSEWMGFYLVHESMLSSVLFARERWLKKDTGLMYPSLAYLYVCPVEMTRYLNENLSYWSSFYNINYQSMSKVYREVFLSKPIVEIIKSDQMIDEEQILASFDLKNVNIKDLESIQEYNLEFSARKDCTLHGFAFWFDVVFDTDEETVILQTGPNSEPTHWKQTIALLPEAIHSFAENNNQHENELVIKENDLFKSFVILNQSDDNPRNYEIDIGVDVGKNDDVDESSEEDDQEHPVPCSCQSIKCVLIKATLEKYENENK